MATNDDGLRRLHPRLRCVNNGAASVNLLRSDISSTVATATTLSTELLGLPGDLDLLAITELPSADLTAHSTKRLAKRPKLNASAPASQSYVNVFVELYRDGGGVDSDGRRTTEHVEQIAAAGQASAAAQRAFSSQVLVRRNLVSATVPIASLGELQADPDVAFVHPSEPITLDRPVAGAGSVKPPTKRVQFTSAERKIHLDGADVIIGIIDVGGFDFAHPDFLDPAGGTRFVSIWDQGGDFRAPPSKRGGSRFDYGSELTKDLMDKAIAAASKKGGLPATFIERQSQRSEASHATHVASIAAGNHGICPCSQIAAVLISVPALKDEVAQRRATFSDSTRIVHAVEYLLEIAEREGKPISINISLGTNGAGHDGSNGVCRWLDALLTAPGRAISVAAGNAGQERGETDDDMGFVMGRIHSSGRISSRGLSVDMEWTVVGNGIEDVSENELEIWYGAQDRITVMLKPPGGQWITVRPREYIQNKRLGSGTTVSIYNELYHPTNGGNYIAIYLSPNLQVDSIRGVQAGVWKVRLIGDEIRNGRFNCWIERDDPLDVGQLGDRRLFRFPSFFSAASNVDSHSINSLACAHRVIAVSNLDDERQRMHISSSQGPTRDDRAKPDIAAPGTNIVAAKGFSEDDKQWIDMTGTSMASPYVAGIVGLMLAVNRDLTSAQCSGILQRTARPLPGSSYEWRNDAGFGVIDATAAVEEARTFNQRIDLDPS